MNKLHSALLTSAATLVFMGSPVNTAWAQQAPSANEAAAAVVENSNLNAEWLMLILLGEMQIAQGDPSAGYSMIFEAARKSGDPALYKRSVEVALAARSGTSALDSAKAWKKAFPKSHEANSYVLQIQIALNQLAESVTTLRSNISLLPPNNKLKPSWVCRKFIHKSKTKNWPMR